MQRKIAFVLFSLALSLNVFSQSSGFEELKSLELMDQIYEHLDQYFVDEISHGKLSKTAIDALLNELDPYTVYYHEANIEDYRLMTTGQYGGIGALLEQHEHDIFISEVYEKNPAQLSGILAGDKLLRIDKQPVAKKSIEEVSNTLKGPKGSSVLLEYERDGIIMSKNVVRDEIKIPDIPYAGMLNQNTGYISLSSFTQTAAEEVRKNILDLQAKGMKQLIFDLRGNGGGLLMEAVKIVGFFVPKGQLVVSTKARAQNENNQFTTQEEPIAKTLPLVVLIDENSASASEIVAGALQDLDRAIVVGKTSYGKGLVQRTFDLKYGSKIKLTIAKYYTPSGRCVQRLEYYGDDRNGAPKEIPDSLLQKFKTSNGRTVIDGRGIEPDVSMNDSSLTSFGNFLLKNHLIFNFATKFALTHESIEKPNNFQLTENEINDFKAFMLQHNRKYQSDETKALEKIRKEIETGNKQSPILTSYESLMQKLVERDAMSFENHRTEVHKLLEREIIGRYYFQKGQIEYSLKHDPVLIKSLEILENPGLLKTVLGFK
jgi:carboxyl-terminal processing protease